MTEAAMMSRRVVPERASDRAFLATAALIFLATASVTVVWCGSMSAMDGMPMPGGWTMSMTWMRMPGQTWAGAAASFLGMWVVMMAAMMLPSLVPMLRRYRDAVAPEAAPRLGRLTALAGAGYLLTWAVYGLLLYPVGVALAAIEMSQPAVSRALPAAAGVIVLIAGLLQLTAWKSRCLGTCRETPGCGVLLRADAATAWRHGVRLAFHCGRCCGNLIAVLLVLGVMDVAAMAAVTAAINAERISPNGGRAARAVGAVAILAGTLLIARAA
jgi:predicted metal-binding membrane protein